jgi:hypothetical protein
MRALGYELVEFLCIVNEVQSEADVIDPDALSDVVDMFNPSGNSRLTETKERTDTIRANNTSAGRACTHDVVVHVAPVCEDPVRV